MQLLTSCCYFRKSALNFHGNLHVILVQNMLHVHTVMCKTNGCYIAMWMVHNSSHFPLSFSSSFPFISSHSILFLLHTCLSSFLVSQWPSQHIFPGFFRALCPRIADLVLKKKKKCWVSAFRSSFLSMLTQTLGISPFFSSALRTARTGFERF